MTHIYEFDNFDEAQAFMQEQEALANANLLPRQHTIVYGSYWIRAVDGDMLEYGYVLPEGEGGDRGAYERGYRFSLCSSVLGEARGDVHLAYLWPIEKEEYDLAKANGWQASHEDWEKDMLIRITHEVDEDNARVAEGNDSRPSDPGSPQEGS